jgi:hypothetical protein
MSICTCGCGKPSRALGLCQRAYNRYYADHNMALLNARRRDYYQANKAKILARKAVERAKNRAARATVPYAHKNVYAQQIVRVPIPGWGCKVVTV